MNKHNLARKKRMDRRKNILRRWKEMKGCQSCGTKGPWVIFDIDHIDHTKKTMFDFNTSLARHSWSHIKEELTNCQVLCRNCHAIKTYDTEAWHNRR